MRVEIVKCPTCGQKLAVHAYSVVDTRVVCANINCNTTLKVVKHNPIKVERVPFEETLNQQSSPESYG
jgi:hypothetical protein